MLAGLCHTHEPTTRVLPDCLYCQRCGNVFAQMQATEAAPAAAAADVIRKYHAPVMDLLIDFADEIFDIIHTRKHIDVEDVRTETLAELRKYSDDTLANEKENVPPNAAAEMGLSLSPNKG